jgi:methyl-accepting chemotaxis protein
MAENKVKITFEVDGIQQSVGSVEELQVALKGVETQAEKTAAAASQVNKEIQDSGKEMVSAAEAGEGAVTVLDEATGGLANQFVQVGKGVQDMGKYLIQSFKGGVQGASAMGKALLATGIGAVVVGVG